MAGPVVNLPGEIWKPVVGYEGRYEVSNAGRVKSLYKGRVRILRACLSGGGYPSVDLSVGNMARTFTVHSLVCAAFIGPRPDGLCIAHYDGDKTNNAVHNLRYATYKDNKADGMRLGETLRGADNPRALLTADDVMSIRSRYTGAHGELSALGREFGVSYQAIRMIVTRRNWKHLPRASAHKKRTRKQIGGHGKH